MVLNRMLAAAALALAMAAPAAAQAAQPAAKNVDLTGTWQMMFQTGQGPIPAQMVVKKDGERLYGTIASEMGSAELEAAVKEKAFTIGFAMSGGGGSFNVTMNGTLDGDAMHGTFDANGMAGEFSGSRESKESKDAKESKETSKEPSTATDAKVDMTGTWNVQVATDTISASPTISIKQEGEKLSGQYQSAQYGAFNFTGTIKGDKFEINVPMTIEGNSMAVFFGGTIDGDSIKGNVAYGDFAQGTFTGTRKK